MSCVSCGYACKLSWCTALQIQGGRISWHFNFTWEISRFKLTTKFPTRNPEFSSNFSHASSTHCGLWRGVIHSGGGLHKISHCEISHSEIDLAQTPPPLRRTHSHSPSPAPSSTPSLQQHNPPPPNAPQGRKSGEGGEEAGQGERDEQREVTRQGRPRSPKTVQSAEGEEGKEKRERIIVVVRNPCQENYPADAHPSAHKSALESANPAWTQSVHLDAPGQQHGQQLVSGTADPGVVKQDKSSRGSVGTKHVRAHRGSE